MNRFWLRSPLMEEAADGGGGAGGGGVFDPVKFKGELMGEVTKMFNGGFTRIEKTLAALKPTEPKPAAEADQDQDQGGGKSADPKVKGLEKRLADLTAKLEASDKARAETEAKAREKERLSLIRSELAKHQLNPDSTDDAFRYFRDEVRFGEDGSLVAGAEETPLAEYVKAVVEKKASWQPPRQVGGAGASSGNRSNQKPLTLADIKPGMSDEEKRRVYAHLAEIHQQS